MPWRKEPMKDVASDEMLRGAASKHRSGDIRMGEPGEGNASSSQEKRLEKGTRGTETS
jgi:hypothetical protein